MFEVEMFGCEICRKEKPMMVSIELHLNGLDSVLVCCDCHSIVLRYRYLLAQAAGRRVTERKSKSSARNGKLGGRPRKVTT